MIRQSINPDQPLKKEALIATGGSQGSRDGL